MEESLTALEKLEVQYLRKGARFEIDKLSLPLDFCRVEKSGPGAQTG
jgi:hypothetical protein